MAYAERTEVSVSKTRAEINDMLDRYKATSFGIMTNATGAIVVFEMHGRRIRFDLPMPDKKERRFTMTNHATPQVRTATAAEAAWEQGCRSRWRALFLCIKAKLESIDAGIETFEDAFLAHVQMPDGQRVGDMVRPAIAETYRTQTMQPLLPGPK